MTRAYKDYSVFDIPFGTGNQEPSAFQLIPTFNNWASIASPRLGAWVLGLYLSKWRQSSVRAVRDVSVIIFAPVVRPKVQKFGQLRCTESKFPVPGEPKFISQEPELCSALVSKFLSRLNAKTLQR